MLLVCAVCLVRLGDPGFWVCVSHGRLASHDTCTVTRGHLQVRLSGEIAISTNLCWGVLELRSHNEKSRLVCSPQSMSWEQHADSNFCNGHTCTQVQVMYRSMHSA